MMDPFSKAMEITKEIQIEKPKDVPDYFKETSEVSESVEVDEVEEVLEENTEEVEKTAQEGTEQDVRQIDTINQHLEGQTVGDTGVEMKRQETIDSDGNRVEGVFPEFDSEFDAQLDPEDYEKSDAYHKKEANAQLKEAIEKDPSLAEQFTPEQLEQIQDGRTPRGYVWHHNEQPGKLQLVDANTHQQVRHTGGRAIWGGGTENR